MYLYIFSGTHLQVRPVNGFSRLMAQTTQTRARICLLGFLDISLHFGGDIPHKPQTCKILTVSYYRNYCIDFNQILHNDRDHKVVIVGGPNRAQQIQGGGRPPFWKKTVKTPYNGIHLTDFDKILSRRLILASYSVSTVKISIFWKFKMAAGAILKNHKNRDIFAKVWRIFTKFGTVMPIASVNYSGR